MSDQTIQDNKEPLDDESKVENWLSELSIDEKLKLLAGKSFWKTRDIPRLGIQQMKLTDGPRGVAFHSAFKRATAFPSGIALAASWDINLTEEFGRALGEETVACGAQVILGPAANICRTPLNGRTFEYFTEDPELNRKLVVPYIRGVQSKGVAACVKHFVANNQETNRMKTSSDVSERALQEIYLPVFKDAVEKADVWTVMGAYNAVNGTAACEHPDLIKSKLQQQWGFDGFVVSDWFALRRVAKGANAIKAGFGLEMPGKGSRFKYKNIRQEYDNGEFNEGELDLVIRRLLRVYLRTEASRMRRQTAACNSDEHRALAQKMSEQSITLLKNDAATLPLNIEKIRTLSVIGPFAKKRLCFPLYGGSAAVWSPSEVTPYRGIKSFIPDHVKLIKDPAKADAVVLIVGIGHRIGGDSELRDRHSMRLLEKQEILIKKTLKANPNTVIVVMAGSPIEMDWISDAKAVLMAWYPGMNSGHAIANVLFGNVSPSGKLPITFPKKLSDSAAHKNERTFPGDIHSVAYEEDIFVGYRHFERYGIEPLFAFGHGLSYTQFHYDNLQINTIKWDGSTDLTLVVDITNTGDIDGAEIVQLYVAPLAHASSSIPRAVKELKGFTKVFLKTGEKHAISFSLSKEAFAHFCPDKNEWTVNNGDYELLVGSASDDIRLHEQIIVEIA